MKPWKDLTTPASLEAVMAPDAGPAVIDMWAPWCRPCLAMAPHFEAVAGAHEGPVRFYKVNTEAHPELGAAFHVRSIPTVIFVNKGQVLDVNVGALDGARLSSKVEWLTKKASGKGLFRRLFGG